jgi:hypothetical protein
MLCSKKVESSAVQSVPYLGLAWLGTKNRTPKVQKSVTALKIQDCRPRLLYHVYSACSGHCTVYYTVYSV